MLKNFIVFILFMSICTAAFGEMMTVVYSGAEVRTEPSAMSSKIIFKPSVNSPLEVVQTGKEYFKVKNYQNLTGYIHKTLLKSQPAVVVTGDIANVRSGPGTDNDVVFQLSKGETALLLSASGDWVEIETSNVQKGWIARHLVWGE